MAPPASRSKQRPSISPRAPPVTGTYPGIRRSLWARSTLDKTSWAESQRRAWSLPRHRNRCAWRKVKRRFSKQQPQGWRFRKSSVDDGLRGARRVAWLAAAAGFGLLAAFTGGPSVRVDARRGLLDRGARPVRAERPWLDDQHIDAQRLHLGRQRFGDAFHRVLRAVVIAGSCETREAADRGNVDDQAAALLAHDRKHRFRHVDQAEHVGLEHCANLIVLTFLDRREIGIAGIVHEHIDATESSLCFSDDTLDLFPLRNIERQDERTVGMTLDDILQ